jgi:hypothetical protein
VYLEGALAEQEEPAKYQDQVGAGDLLTYDREKRLGQPDDPGQREEEQDPHEHSQPKPYDSRSRLGKHH